MLKLLGVPYIVAPGEAEAECALLQKEGVVDAVLSEDVDTLMFGCTKLLRNWNGDAARKGPTPTHVDMYDAAQIKAEKHMDREGIVLAALMSGGDYLPEGIPNCGIKTACESARAGFGRDLLAVPKGDKTKMSEWRERLEHELQTNDRGFFRTKHKALKVPADFPDHSVLYYYSQPIVSAPDQVARYREEIQWGAPMDIAGLRNFVAEAFEWRYKIGVKHFIRGLAPSLLTARMAPLGTSLTTSHVAATQGMEETGPISKITKQRNHASSDGMRELRVTFVPAEVVGIDIDQEEEMDHTAAFDADPDEEDLAMASAETEDTTQRESPEKQKRSMTPDPPKEQKEWMWEVLVRRRMPRTFAEWEASQNKPAQSKAPRERKAAAKTSPTKGGMPQGALGSFVRITRPGLGRHPLASSVDRTSPVKASVAKPRVPRTPTKTRNVSDKRPVTSQGANINPWSLARVSQGSYSPVAEERPQKSQAHTNVRGGTNQEAILIESSPPEAPKVAQPMFKEMSGRGRSSKLEAAKGLEISEKDPFIDCPLTPEAQPKSKTWSPARSYEVHGPRNDSGTHTPIRKRLIPSSSPSLPSPSDLLASVIPTQERSTRQPLKPLKSPKEPKEPKEPRVATRRRTPSTMAADALLPALIDRCSAGIEVLDLTSD